MDTTDFQTQLDQALNPSIQRALQLQIKNAEAGPRAVFEVSGESWALTFEATCQRWQVHAPCTNVPLWFLTEELMQSLLVLRTYRLSQVAYAHTQVIRVHLDDVLTVRGDDGQAVTLSPRAAIELLDVLTVSEPALRQLVQGAGA
jgi:hypothetical protein